VGNSKTLSTLTLTQSNGATFAAAVTTGTSVVLSNTVAGQSITFADNLTTPTLTTTANGYNLALLGSNTNISGTQAPTVFNNTGSLTLGNSASDVLTFGGGLTATSPNVINAAGQINTSGLGVINLGDSVVGSATGVTLTDDVVLSTAGGNLNINGAINGNTVNTQSLTLNATSAGTVSVTSTLGQTTSLKTLTLTHSNGATFESAVKADTSVVLGNTTAGQTIAFQDNLTTPTLTTTANGYNLGLLGSNTNISGTQAATVFNNTGTLT
jgi:hypothetical protein